MKRVEIIDKIKDHGYSRGIDVVKEIPIDEIIVSNKVREACKENKCGKYGRNFMCPPYVKTVEEFKEELNSYNMGLFFIIKKEIDNINDMEEVYKPAKKLHRIILEAEDMIEKDLGLENYKGLIGGDCKLCTPCNAALDKNYCQYPDRARPSLEAMGIDVISTCRSKGINIEFIKEQVTWVGMLLLTL